MGLCNPDYIFAKTTNITVEFLQEKGIEYLLLDVDNTLTTHGNPEPAPGIIPWLAKMQENGIKLIIVSNNYGKRVKPFADLLGLPCVSFSAKPLSLGIRKAMKALGAQKHNTAMVGDQVFTDVIGGHLKGLMSIMVLAIKEEDALRFRLKRNFEKKFVDEYIKKNGGVL